MAINITFWWLLENEKEFLKFVEKDNRVVALPLESTVPKNVDSVCKPHELIEKQNVERMFITFKELLPEVKYIQYEKGGKTLFGIDAVNSPVITYSRSVFRKQNKLGQGAISAHLNRLTKNEINIEKKNDEFVTWAKTVIARARKSTPKWHQYKTYRISEGVAKAIENGLELVF